MRIDVLTIFPGYLAPLHESLIGKGRQAGILDIHLHDLRAWTSDVHRTVDDAPYGGGPGMVMLPDVWGRALDDVVPAGDSPSARLIVPTPGGRPFTQRLAAEYAQESHLVFACGRYEGIDARVLDEAASRMRVDEVSLGDYVLAGGEVAVLVIVEAVGRLLPGVLGNAASVHDDSFAPGEMAGLLEGPSYTRPALWRGRPVPEILTSGNHAAIARWRRDQALARTARRRPDLIAKLDPSSLDARDRAVLDGALGERWDHGFSSATTDVAD